MQKNKQFVKFFQALIALAKFKNDAPYYRILQLPTEQDPCIHVQVINSRAVVKMFPQDVMRDDMLLHFSREDIAVITHLGTKNEVKENFQGNSIRFFKILRQIFKKNKTAFLIEKEDGQIEEHTADDIFNNSKIAEKLTGADGIKVGYSVAEEHYTRVTKLKNISR